MREKKAKTEMNCNRANIVPESERVPFQSDSSSRDSSSLSECSVAIAGSSRGSLTPSSLIAGIQDFFFCNHCTITRSFSCNALVAEEERFLYQRDM